MATTVTLKPNAIDISGSTSGVTTLQATAVAGTTTVTLPAATDTLVGKATTDTLTNKTLTAPVISTIINTGTLTLPTSTDTLIGRATTDTLTNKTLTSPTLTTPISTTTLSVGNATPSASGAGITFPATQSASTDANTLDDYEEGTWTPAITFGGGSTGITYSFQQGFYTKIGNTVTVQFRINLSSKGSSTGSAVLGGLPFSVGGTYSQNYLIHDNAAGFNAGFGLYWSMEGGVSGNLRQIGTNGSNALDNTNFNNNTAVFGILTYRV
jgi:hypothetical protein